MFEAIEAEAVINPTEDVERVKRAMLNLIPTLESWEVRDGVLRGRTTDPKALSRLYELFRGQAILDTAREKLEDGSFGDEIIVQVNRQAAYAGVVNFNEEGPLGPITIVIKTRNPKRLMRWLAPRTKDGVPIE
ncbi:MAG: hypothetical protein GXO14_02315 [Thermococci archaeon]|nr:hypothetical protein [Thermococci archaeon]